MVGTRNRFEALPANIQTPPPHTRKAQLTRARQLAPLLFSSIKEHCDSFATEMCIVPRQSLMLTQYLTTHNAGTSQQSDNSRQRKSAGWDVITSDGEKDKVPYCTCVDVLEFRVHRCTAGRNRLGTKFFSQQFAAHFADNACAGIHT
jgi:hypothetical protein